MKFIRELEDMDACTEAIEWASQYDTFQEAWDACDRADWMLWIAGMRTNRKEVVSCACKCARTVLKYFPKREKRPLRSPLRCIEVVERWVKGDVTMDEIRQVKKNALHYCNAAHSLLSIHSVVDITHACSSLMVAVYSSNVAVHAMIASGNSAETLKELSSIVRESLESPL